MARPNPLTDSLRVDIGRRIAAGEGIRALAREYKIAESTLRSNFSAQAPKIRDVAQRLATAEADLLRLPVTAQCSARILVDQLRDASTSLAAAAVNGAQINERLTGLAVKRLGTITEDSSPEDLKPIAALVATGNEAAKPALELVKASRSIQREEADEPAKQASMSWTVKVVRAGDK